MKRSNDEGDCLVALDVKRKLVIKLVNGNQYVVDIFVQRHNHFLVDKENLQFLRSCRKLTFSQKVLIHQISNVNMGLGTIVTGNAGSAAIYVSDRSYRNAIRSRPGSPISAFRSVPVNDSVRVTIFWWTALFSGGLYLKEREDAYLEREERLREKEDV
ncbi:hypothetical protein Tco_1251289 [Tanacetum coccineum]